MQMECERKKIYVRKQYTDGGEGIMKGVEEEWVIGREGVKAMQIMLYNDAVGNRQHNISENTWVKWENNFLDRTVSVEGRQKVSQNILAQSNEHF